MLIDAITHKYRTGACFAMAEALHRLTGFPVRCIDFAGCTHAFVVSPNNDVLDIHGRMPWNDFLAFMVREGNLPKYAVADGLVQAEEIPNPPSLLWLHASYKPPALGRKAQGRFARHVISGAAP